VRWTALALVALALSGCETTAEKSAQLERQAKMAAEHAHSAGETGGVTRASAYVKVLSSVLIEGAETSAAVVTVRNSSPHAFRALPIEISVSEASGGPLFKNTESGSEAALVSIPSLPADGELTWVDDQVPQGGSSVSARVGEGRRVSASVPRITVAGVHVTEGEGEGTSVGVAGTVVNRSNTAQQKLVVSVLASRGGRVVAAARSLIAELVPGASASFQGFFVGNPHGARLSASAPASTF
jgi:hypothetical protein